MTWCGTTRVAIVTEGTEETGFGHIIRCSSLYEALLDSGDDPLFIINGNASVLPIVKSYNHVLFNWLQDRDRCKKYIANCDVVIVDSYLAERDFYSEIASIAPVNVYVDDNKRLDFPEGIILNGAVYALDLGYSVKGKHGNLLGTQFFLLRKPFQATHKKAINKKIKTVMVVFGATDVRKMTMSVLEFLVKNFPDLEKKVVVGTGLQGTCDLNEKRYAKVDFLTNIDAQGMMSLMLKADLAISACGTTLYELAYLGVPTIGIGVVDNQLLNVKRLTEIGFLNFAGWWNEPTLFENLLFSMRALAPFDARAAVSRIGQDLVKGMGSVEVIRRIKAAWLQEKLVFSRAARNQCDLFFKWANDSEARKNSFNPAPIPYETHVKWFEGKLDSKTNFLFVGYINSTPVGQIRIDIEGSSGIISYSIDKEWRGKGLGTAFLERLPTLLHENVIKVNQLIGKVKVGNTISQKVFENAGFQKIEEIEFLEYVKEVK